MHYDGTIDPEVADAIRALFNAGHQVVIATGRSVDSTLPVVEELRIRPEWVICCNGAVTLKRDPLATRAYRHQYVEAFDATELLTRLRRRLLSATYGVETPEGEFLFTKEIPAGTLPRRQRLTTFDQLLGVQATRVLVVSPDESLEESLSDVDALGLSRVTYGVGFLSWLDIAPEGVSKESALEVVRAQNRIDLARVFAAGDGNNDIEMLQWAGRHGDAVVMGQARPEVRRAGTRVTGTIEEQGLFHALRDRFPAILG